MDHKDEMKELEFDLEDILSEFGSTPAPQAQPDAVPQPPAEVSAPEPSPEEPSSGEAPAVQEAPSEEAPAPQAAAKTEPAPAESAPAPRKSNMPSPESHGAIHSLEDTGPMPHISLADLAAASREAAAPAEEAPAEEAASEAQAADEPTLDADDLLTQVLSEMEEAPKETEADTDPDSTQRFSMPEKQEPTAQIESAPIPAPIPFSTPRSRLKELKKKLVAGPEKRYYALSEAGIGKLQAAIAVSLLVVLLCAGITTMFVLDMVPANRLRLVIFSQVLAMLVSALMGCQLMLDAIGDLFKGRFSVNTLLTISFFVCLTDAVFCLEELRVPCCAAFCLSMTMALWGRYHRHTTEMAQMDTMRKAVRLHGIVKKKDYYEGQDGLLQVEGEVEDFMDTYSKPSGPEKLQGFYAFLSLVACIAIAVFAGLTHGIGMGVQILSTSLLVAVPASFFVATTRPAAVLAQRLHMVGSVICGWQGVKGLRGKAVFPLEDTDLFPQGCTKLNGVKFYNGHNPDEVISYTTSLIQRSGGGLLPLFQQLLTSRDGATHPVEDFRNYGGGGIGGVVCGQPVLMGDMAFLQDMGVVIPEGTMVSQAVYAAMDGELCAVFAISYAKMRSAAAGLVTLSGYRRLKPMLVGSDFMLTEEFIRAKFGVKTRRILFPDPDTRSVLRQIQPDADAPVLALSTREDLLSSAYAVTGARALSTATRLGVALHLVGGILGILMMLVLAVLGSTELLIPTNILLYQLIWAVPGLLVTEWARTV